MVTHGEISDLLAAYALDAVVGDEYRVVEGHLEQCPRCWSELDAFRDVAAGLGNSVVPLPDGVWLSIERRLSRVESETQAVPGLIPGPGPGPGQSRCRASALSTDLDSRWVCGRRVHFGGRGCRGRAVRIRTRRDTRRCVPAPGGAEFATDQCGRCPRDARAHGCQSQPRQRTNARSIRPGGRSGVPGLVEPARTQVVGDLPALGCRQRSAHLAGPAGRVSVGFRVHPRGVVRAVAASHHRGAIRRISRSQRRVRCFRPGLAASAPVQRWRRVGQFGRTRCHVSKQYDVVPS